MKKIAEHGTSNAEMITISRAEYDEFQELKAQNQWLMQQLRLVRQKQFGSSSEKASEEVMEQLSLLFNEAEVYADGAKEQANVQTETEPAEIKVSAHTRKKSGSVKDVVPKDIPVEVVEHRLTEEKLACPQCGKTMAVIGKEVRESLVLKPAEMILRRDVYYTYACRECDKNDITTPVVKTPKEPALIPGGFASPEAVAHLMVQKFVMGSPLYRQEQEWNRRGLKLPRQTMSNWLVKCSEDYLTPVCDELKAELVKHDLLHADETELQVLREPGKKATSKSYMWLYRTSSDAKHPIVLYEYQPDRKQERPQTFLKGFHGYLQTDGYSGYHGVEDVIHVGCWAHARRKFDEAVKALPKGKQAASSAAVTGLAYCTKLFQLEQEYTAQGLNFEERKQQRLERSKPVLDAMLTWAETRNAAPKSKLGQALTYLKNQWPYLTNFLLDGRIELSNNRAERSIKPFVIARKNFLFANTPGGAQASAVIFSLIETAKENGMDPYRYLCYVLKMAPKLDRTEDHWTRQLLPENIPADY